MSSEEKRQTIDRFLIQGLTEILIDARQPGVSVPTQHRDNGHLFLNLSYRFGTPLHVTPWGIRQVLTFNGENYPVEIPWRALTAARALDGEIGAWAAPEEPPAITNRRGHLGLVH